MPDWMQKKKKESVPDSIFKRRVQIGAFVFYEIFIIAKLPSILFDGRRYVYLKLRAKTVFLIQI